MERYLANAVEERGAYFSIAWVSRLSYYFINLTILRLALHEILSPITILVMKKLHGYGTAIVCGLIGLILVNVPLAVNLFRRFTESETLYAERFGAFAGGYFGSIFSLVTLVLLFATLRSQILSAAQQNFETKYFELIKMHRDNVAEIGMNGDSGRILFVLLLRELR
jgi:hypothetical protein